MANVFGILTAIVLALSAFIAVKNKNAYDNEIIGAATAASDLERSTSRLTAAQEQANALPLERTQIDETVEALTKQQAELEAAKQALSAERDDKSAKIAANQARLDEIADKTKEIGEIRQLAERMRTTNSELEELRQSITSTEATLANLLAENTQAETLVSSRRGEFELMSRGESLPGLNTRISAVYPSWGFVTLAAGDNAGVTTNSTLNVVRNGEVVGKLLVTAVERTTSSASIIPDSVGSDVTLRVGDRVVPGQRASNSSTRN